jgi:hypothetical protein
LAVPTTGPEKTRHTSACNVIERIFGVLKQQFKILLLPPAYNMDIQGQLPATLCALHNFILANEVDAVSDCSMGRLDDDNIISCHDEALFQDTSNELAEGDMDDRRDAIAKNMWEDYQRRLAARISDEEDEDNSSDGDGDGG